MDGILETKIENKLNAKLTEEKIDSNTEIQRSNQEIYQKLNKSFKILSNFEKFNPNWNERYLKMFHTDIKIEVGKFFKDQENVVTKGKAV